MILFSDRLKFENEFDEWAIKNHVEPCAASVIVWLQSTQAGRDVVKELHKELPGNKMTDYDIAYERARDARAAYIRAHNARRLANLAVRAAEDDCDKAIADVELAEKAEWEELQKLKNGVKL